MNNILWNVIRCAITLACVYTLQTIINSEGYRVEFRTLLVAAIVVIIGVRFWMPSHRK